MRFPSCVFIVVSLWIILHIYVHICRCESAYVTIQHCPIWCLCQQSSSRIQNEPGYRKRQFLSITTRHQRKGQRKMLELKEVKKNKNKKNNKNKRATNRWTDWREKKERKERKKRGRQRAGRKEEEKKNKKQEQTSNRKEKRKKKKNNRKCKWIAHSCNFYLSLCYLNWV